MQRQRCKKCLKRKSVTLFHRKGSRYQGTCKACRRVYHRKHYLANKPMYIASAYRKRDRLRAVVDALKKAPCMDCRKRYHPWVMEFDHTGTDNAANVTKLVRAGNEQRLLREIAKCDLVCANCHRMRTFKRFSRV